MKFQRLKKMCLRLSFSKRNFSGQGFTVQGSRVSVLVGNPRFFKSSTSSSHKGCDTIKSPRVEGPVILIPYMSFTWTCDQYLTIWKYRQYCRYHLVIPTVPWEPLLMQDLVCCDYFRTPVKFQGVDIYRFVGICNFQEAVRKQGHFWPCLSSLKNCYFNLYFIL